MSSSSSMMDDCPSFEYDPHGRQGIGVAQPQSGTDYPLVMPSEDVRFLLADCQLNIDDPGLYGDTPWRPPFRIHWLYGVGCEGPDASCFATPEPSSQSSSLSSSLQGTSLSSESLAVDAAFCPAHAAEITVVDADNRVVFHSPETATFRQRPWGNRLHMYEWRDGRLGTCLLLVHTKWPEEQSNFVPKNYPLYFFPEVATLDARIVFVLPKRVRSINVILDTLEHVPIDFSAGYNMELAIEDAGDSGLRHVNKIRFNAAPGAGLGIFPGCDPEPLVIRRVNGVGPTTAGDFYMAATDCYWIRQPTRLLSTDPRVTYPQIALSPGNVPTAGLPDPNAGSAKNLPGWPTDDSPTLAHIQIGNDCPPCCDCPDYVAVGKYMNTIRDQYHVIGVDLESSRDLYHENIDRWLLARGCFHRRPLRIFMLAQVCPFLDVAIQFCNQSDQCLLDLALNVTLGTSPVGGAASEVPGFTFITGATSRPGRRSTKTERYSMDGGWPTFIAYFDAVNPGQSVHARFRLSFGNCGIPPGDVTPYAVTGSLTGMLGEDPILVREQEPDYDSSNSSQSSAMLVEALAEDTQVLRCPPDEGDTFDPLKCVSCQ